MVKINWVLALSFFVLFIALMAVLNAVLFQPVLRHLETRRAHLEKDQGSAEEDLALSQKLKAEAESVVLDAKKEAFKIKEEAQSAARSKADELLGAERAAIASELAQFEESLQKSEAELKNALLGQAPLFKERIKTKFIAA